MVKTVKLERVGHRGAPHVYPANTLRSFQAARDMGCTMVECDIRLSQDHALVLAHDPQVRDSNGKEWVISRCTQAELAALDLGAGQGVPTLEELVAWLDEVGGISLMADMKCAGDGVEARVAEALAPLPRERKCVSGAERESRAAFRIADPGLPILLTVNREISGAQPDDWFEQMFANWNDLDADGGSWQHTLVTPERVAAMHAVGGLVFAWTVDDIDTMRRLKKCGVDGITSNRADLFASL